jgi:hypothetical protein
MERTETEGMRKCRRCIVVRRHVAVIVVGGIAPLVCMQERVRVGVSEAREEGGEEEGGDADARIM